MSNLALPARFRCILLERCLVKPGDALVIGVSGGSDSLALLHLFKQIGPNLGLKLHVLHINHQIRGADADADAQFVAATARAWSFPCHVHSVDVPALAASHKLSLEEAARQARYTALGRLAEEIGAQAVAVGHNADDQAETVLMHLLRGSGLAGLRGMLPITMLTDYHLLEPINRPVWLIRPLLDVTRAEIEAYCVENHLTPRFDRSNIDQTYFRNRLRHEVLPLLETLIPNVGARLRRTAEVLRADYDLLQAQVEQAWAQIVRAAGDERITLDRDAWRALPLSLQRATLRRATWQLRRTLRDVSFVHVENAMQVAQWGETGAQATLPAGLNLRVTYDALVVAPPDHSPPAPDWPLLRPGAEIEVPVPGRVSLPGEGWLFSLEPYTGPRDGHDWAALLSDPWAAPLDASRLTGRLILRPRRPGDRFRPQGVGGTQRISAFMIDKRIPAAWRDSVPLLVADGEIAWVAGFRVAESYTVSPETPGVTLARFRRE